MDTTTMEQQIQSINYEGLNALYFVLAYAGMVIHLLFKLAEVYHLPEFTFGTFMKKNLISILISIVGIPVLLICLAGTSLSEWLPLNEATAVLCGWQTQSLFKTVFSMYGNKKLKTNTTDSGNTSSSDENNTNAG